MTKPRVTIVALFLISISAINIVYSQLAGTQQDVVVMQIRFALTCLVAYQLKKGKEWARVLTAILLAIGSVISLLAFPKLLPQAFGVDPIRTSWFVFMTVAFAMMAVYLGFSKGVKQECADSKEKEASILESIANLKSSDGEDQSPQNSQKDND